MKPYLFIAIGFCCSSVLAQTNIFPATGNVGIGVASPSAKLDVRGGFSRSQYGIVTPTINIFSNESAGVDKGAAIAIGGKTGNGNPDYSFAYLFGGKETSAYDNYAGYFAIYTVSPGNPGGEVNSANYERLRVTSTGNVGIGTTVPNEKLSVNGNIRAKEIKVEAANWPDYVFHKEYKLPSLLDTEKHIREKGHLPGIPSAAEVAASGVELGEMNKKLLEKIEELTLHLIELNKQVQRQEQKLNSLNSSSPL